MFGLGTTELIIVLVIVLVLFGGKKLRSLGSDLGGAISEFKTSMSDEEEEQKSDETVAAEKTETKEASGE
jgi:sec-independent protein translocase protein TatA